MINEVSIIIPAFNEELAIRQVITELQTLAQEHDITAEIIVVDDGSADATARAALGTGVRVIQHRNNRGYGASLKSGIEAASYDIIAITDADGTYPARHLPQMLRQMDCADMVVGARTGQNVHIPLVRRPAKWLLKHLANYVANAHIPDLNSGLRVFRRDIAIQYFPILPNYFSFTTTITLAMFCDNYAVTYVPIDYRKRQGKSKIVPWDAGSFAILILRTAMLFKPLRVFIPVALVCLTYGLAKITIDLFRDPNISASAMFGLMSALMLMLIGMLGDAISVRLGRLNPHTVMSIRPREVIELESLPVVVDPNLYALKDNLIASVKVK